MKRRPKMLHANGDWLAGRRNKVLVRVGCSLKIILKRKIMIPSAGKN